MWYVSHVEKNMGKQGTNAVNTPFFDGPSPIVAVSQRLARVQFKESMPWLQALARAQTSINTLASVLE